VDVGIVSAFAEQMPDAMRQPPAPAPVPEQSVWPVVVGAGITLLFMGVVTSFAFSALGAALVVWGVRGWIAELFNARTE